MLVASSVDFQSTFANHFRSFILCLPAYHSDLFIAPCQSIISKLRPGDRLLMGFIRDCLHTAEGQR